jgi:hypothetical protein
MPPPPPIEPDPTMSGDTPYNGPTTSSAPIEYERPPDPETQWADAETLGGDAEFEDIKLPQMGVMVRVRYLPTPEVAALSYMPDLLDYLVLAQRLHDIVKHEDDAKPMTADERRAFVTENMRYQARLSHLAVMDHRKPFGEPVKCDDCEIVHPPSLWSNEKTARLTNLDLDLISRTALSQSLMKRVESFLGETTPYDSASRADSGQSTPPTS